MFQSPLPRSEKGMQKIKKRKEVFSRRRHMIPKIQRKRVTDDE